MTIRVVFRSGMAGQIACKFVFGVGCAGTSHPLYPIAEHLPDNKGKHVAWDEYQNEVR